MSKQSVSPKAPETDNPVIEPIRCVVVISGPAEQVFHHFVHQIGRWWPMGYTWSGAKFATARIDKHPGGKWFEISKDGTHLEWGEVRSFQPGEAIVLSFNVGADRQPEPPERQSEVQFSFVPDGHDTRLIVEHRHLEVHGDGNAIRDGMASDQGWPLILESFAREMRYVKASGKLG